MNEPSEGVDEPGKAARWVEVLASLATPERLHLLRELPAGPTAVCDRPANRLPDNLTPVQLSWGLGTHAEIVSP